MIAVVANNIGAMVFFRLVIFILPTVAPRFCFFLDSVTAIVPIVAELGVDVKQVPQRASRRNGQN
jgi:hypothetical protein